VGCCGRADRYLHRPTLAGTCHGDLAGELELALARSWSRAVTTMETGPQDPQDPQAWLTGDLACYVILVMVSWLLSTIGLIRGGNTAALVGRYDAPGGFSPGTAQFPGPSPPLAALRRELHRRQAPRRRWFLGEPGRLYHLVDRAHLDAGCWSTSLVPPRKRGSAQPGPAAPVFLFHLHRSCSCRQVPFEEGEGDESESISRLLHYGAPKQHDKASASHRAASAGGIGRFLHS
jgi:hypothetical protein